SNEYALSAGSRSIFVTVGSTGFDALVRTVTSAPFLHAAVRAGYQRLTVQYGRSKPTFTTALSSNSSNNALHYHYNPVTDETLIQWVEKEYDSSNKTEYDYRPSLAGDLRMADLVISHAGSGSILETLRWNKPLIVVANTDLMDNHQAELAVALHKEDYLVAAECDELITALNEQRHMGLVPFPAQAPERFSSILEGVIQFPESKKQQ
ncbi:glycosyl transferase, partial [Syncephalis fuscata]